MGVWEVLRWPLRAAAVVIGHFAVGWLVITLLWAGERYIQFLWGEQEPMFFDVVPLRWLFHALDLAIILLFGFRGLVAANYELKAGRNRI